jgi:hypothetical protein
MSCATGQLLAALKLESLFIVFSGLRRSLFRMGCKAQNAAGITGMCNKPSRRQSQDAAAAIGWPSALLCLSRQQCLQATACIQRYQIVAAAHVRLADKNLRHGAPACDGDHAITLGGIEIDPDFLDNLHPARLEQLLGANTKRAHGGGVHLD